MEKYEPVVITGIGIVSSIGHNISSFINSLKNGYVNVTQLPNINENFTYPRIGAYVKDFNYKEVLQRYKEEETLIVQQALRTTLRSTPAIGMTTTACIEAWNMAGCTSKPVQANRKGIIVAGNNLMDEMQYSTYEQFKDKPNYISPSYCLQFMDTQYLGILSELFNIKGVGFTTGGASASGNVAIIQALWLLRTKQVDCCMVVGPAAGFSPMTLQSLHNIGAIGGKTLRNEAQKACRPFDKAHEGFIYGQAGACMILENIECAKERKVPILGRIIGSGQMLHASRASEPSEEAEITVMKKAIEEAQINVNDIDYINTHGTSTPLGDITEIKAIKNIMGDHCKNVWINSTKGLVGHCMYSAGIVEAISTILQIKYAFLHPNLNLENPIDEEMRWVGSTARAEEIKVGLSNSFGFNGINTSIILERA